MTSLSPPPPTSILGRMRAAVRRLAAKTAQRMAPRDADSGREPLSRGRKVIIAAGCFAALIVWGAVFLWITR